MENVTQKNEKSISGAIKIDEKEIGDHLNQLVRQSVEDTINSLLDAEADAICNATRYQHSPDRLDSRAGSYKRKLLTTSGEVELTVPRLRRLPFETQIIQRYQTKQSSVEEALIEMLGSFPDGYSAMMLVGARLRHISTTKWGTRQYLCTCKIYEQGVI